MMVTVENYIRIKTLRYDDTVTLQVSREQYGQEEQGNTLFTNFQGLSQEAKCELQLRRLLLSENGAGGYGRTMTKK